MDSVECVKSVTKYSARIENVSELKEKLKIALDAALLGSPGSVVLDYSSGMIKLHQKAQRRRKFLHTKLDSGYSVPDYSQIARTFNIPITILTISNLTNYAN